MKSSILLLTLIAFFYTTRSLASDCQTISMRIDQHFNGLFKSVTADAVMIGGNWADMVNVWSRECTLYDRPCKHRHWDMTNLYRSMQKSEDVLLKRVEVASNKKLMLLKELDECLLYTKVI